MNLGFEKIKVYYDGDDTTNFHGKVVLEPLERGFARTLGNTLRRIMISSMPGTSVIGIKIPSIYHEFTSIPGAVTDMTELILNLKDIRFKTEGEELKTVKFEAGKAGTYTADALHLPTGVELMNPEQELIQLTGESIVEFEVYLKRSRGYEDASQQTEFKDRPDVIAIDGLYTPIRRVRFEEEGMRIGQDASYERLLLEVWTDGSISAKDAVMLAGKIAQSHFSFFEEMSDIAEKTEIYQEKKEEEDRIMEWPIEHMDLSVRAYNCLRRDGYTTVRKIYELSETQLYSIPQMGVKSVREVIDKMKDLGLELKKD